MQGGLAHVRAPDQKFSTILVSFALSAPPLALAGDDGIVKVKSAYPLAATIERLKSDIAGKGISFFDEIDQSKLAADAGIKLRPSVLLVFGNPPLGTQFITANAAAGLDWPVRLLVFENESGEVWMAYTDFSWIAAAMASRAATISSIWPPSDRVHHLERAGKITVRRLKRPAAHALRQILAGGVRSGPPADSDRASIREPFGISFQQGIRQ